MRSLCGAALILLAVPALAGEEQPAPEAAAPIKRYGLQAALDRALSANAALLVSQEEIRRATALLEEARAPSLPQLNANAVATRIDSNRELAGRVIQGVNSLNGSVTLALPINPRNWYQWSHASENVDVSRASSADTRRLVAVSAARAWLAVLSQHRVVEVNQRANKTAQQHFDYAHGRRVGGVGTRLDEVRAEQELASTQASVEQSQAALVRTQEALGILIGDSAPADVEGKISLPEPPKLDEALQESQSNRTDVKLAHARSAAALHVVNDSWADFLPFLTGQFTPFYQNPPTLTQPQTGWQAQLLLTLPLYDGGLRYGQGRERAALAAEAKTNLDAALRQAQSDVRTAFETVMRAEAALKSAQRSAQLARESLDLSNQAYKAGATTNLDVIDAERRALDADTTVAVAEDALRQARLDLLAASGRFPGNNP